VPNAGSISTLFSDVESQVIDARSRLTEFAEIQQSASELQRAANHDAMHAAKRLRKSAQTLS
jgi:cell fate (sporulation/competence/biofilm development) regulator YlbF (YheA/YmcA/DUF963 family)